MPRVRDPKPLYNRLRVLRADMTLSRAELASRVGVNPQTIGAIERGDHSPSLALALDLCEVFDLPVEAVFSRTPFPPLSAAYAGRGHGRPAPTPQGDDDSAR
ncbi:helix-turn-helix transcriptional regulator [Georgenia faecalis]|uniref:helix-turn-helix transcriptional regulator n=1 Tax=Georgenia faecalis TaxID=2483799 RepID=UPI000FD945AB|nr:helix-turn-helix transcriptional regulator [Georgenia faecalis]